ncbi:uncharacterized protein LOC110682102 isoform X1 [Chenopodium quinoa]|uniref:uncharacterized protein LOC110682102 isoform X1 n=2 Tax=Chenopodium quinoa TaxID=63459 RepID=UPI000B792A5C|nr:uncharacterized protein LOC110682102 isoform X1 [Chenopodium quinoa]
MLRSKKGCVLICVNLAVISNRKMPAESEKWGWKHVSVFGGFDRGSGTKRWKCNHCNQRYNGSYSRVRAHLLGYNGLGVKPCPAIDNSVRETFSVFEKDRVAKKLMKKKGVSSSRNTMTKYSVGVSQQTEPVDDIVARFFYVDGVNVNVVNSAYFREMVKTVGAFGPSYELPSMEHLSGSLLSKEKVRLEKALALARESWPNTGCTILCVNRLDGSLGCFCVNFFVASPRGVMFLKEVDIIEGDVPDNLFINELTNVIAEVGSSNVFQVITRLDVQVSDVFESVILSKFPNIFWSHCTSHSVLLLMEEMANLDCMKDVVSTASEIERCVSAFRSSSSCTNIDALKGSRDQVSQKFAPSFSLVRKILEIKSTLYDLVVREEWKQWRLQNSQEVRFNVEAIIARDDFWGRANLMVEVFEPFMRLLATIDVDKSMGDVYNWQIMSLESLRSKGIKDELLLNQVELLIENRWDKLFSPLHGAAYMLHPKHFGKGQNKNKCLMRAWNATLERYESGFESRRVLREELGVYWRAEVSFGEEDAADCRNNMEPVTWWENFGFETPHLQTLAIKILSQIPSAAIMCEESWQLCDSMPCRDAVEKLGFGSDQAKDYVFVRNNLKLQALRHRKVGGQSGLGCGNWGICC